MPNPVGRQGGHARTHDGDDWATRPRSDVLLAEIIRQIQERKASIDAATDLGEITFCVKWIAGSVYIKAVEYSEHRVFRRAG